MRRGKKWLEWPRSSHGEGWPGWAGDGTKEGGGMGALLFVGP